MTDPSSAVVVYCRGCQHAWWDAGDCTCTCDDESAPGYEDWTVDPEDIPAGTWVDR